MDSGVLQKFYSWNKLQKQKINKKSQKKKGKRKQTNKQTKEKRRSNN